MGVKKMNDCTTLFEAVTEDEDVILLWYVRYSIVP